ncbi:MAG: oligosaccharide flippase family protein [Halobacteriovoraceae bacterium]|nr:oligosaccharide flippase family protein [Halobacteriovoraceae bacterium]
MNQLKRRINNIVKHDVFSSVSVLATGSALSKIAPMLMSPVIARLYSPTEFGIFASLLVWVKIFIPVGTGKLENTLVLEEDEIGAHYLLKIALLWGFVDCLIISLFFTLPISFDFMGLEAVPKSLLQWIPLTVLVCCYLQLFQFWFNRHKRYKLKSSIMIQASLVTPLTKVLYAFLILGSALGLVVGNFIGTLIPVLTLAWFYKKHTQELWKKTKLSKSAIKKYLSKYKDFPTFIAFTGLVNAAGTQALPFYLSKYHPTEVLGNYNLAMKMLVFPISIMATSYGEVFFQKISRTESDRKVLGKVYKSLLALGGILLIPVGVIYLWGEPIFSFVFGNEWLLAGKISAIISIALLFKFTVSTVSTALFRMGKTKWVSIWQFLYFAVTYFVLYFYRHSSIYHLLYAFVAVEITMYLAYLFTILYHARKLAKS